MAEHVEFEALVAWWLAELPDAEAGAVEGHLFGCAACARRGEVLAGLAGGIRAAVREGRAQAVVSVPFIEAMKAQGLRLREYPVPPGGSARCTLGSGDDAVISRMQAELGGVRRLDLLARIEVGGREVHAERLEDVPFDAGAGEVLFLPSSAMLRQIPVHIARVRLVSVEEGAERELGEYTFVHAPQKIGVRY